MNERFFNQALETLAKNNCKKGDCISAFNMTVDSSGCSPTAILPVVEDKRNMEEAEEKKSKYAIRKLTPRECWRLMNFSDNDFEKAEKVNSNSQLYKQAGNSIVVACLCALFSQLGIQGHKKWNEMSVEERRSLVYKGTFLEGEKK